MRDITAVAASVREDIAEQDCQAVEWGVEDSDFVEVRRVDAEALAEFAEHHGPACRTGFVSLSPELVAAVAGGGGRA